jgi:carbamoyltransferase
LEAGRSESPLARDIAASIQYIFEMCVVRAAVLLHERTQKYNGGNLCLSGGAFLNPNANMQVKLKTPFRHIHLFPAYGDDGTAAGAAMYVTHHFGRIPRIPYEPREYMFLGKQYSVPQVGTAYNAREIARALSNGKIVAWFQGRSEFGPRALGHRSILADPRNPDMKDTINSRVKHREWYRPFAPVVPSERAAEWFEIDFESKLMLFIARILQPEKIPAVSHVDGSARLQTLQRDDNPVLYDLLKEFDSLTGVPLLLNTSLNGNGEPLVETPQDAINFFNRSPVDILVSEDRVLTRNHSTPPGPALAQA